jgi:hypothetical protein
MSQSRLSWSESAGLITRRSQVQILPPLLGKALETGPFSNGLGTRIPTSASVFASTARSTRSPLVLDAVSRTSTAPCHAAGRGFESHHPRFAKSPGMVPFPVNGVRRGRRLELGSAVESAVGRAHQRLTKPRENAGQERDARAIFCWQGRGSRRRTAGVVVNVDPSNSIARSRPRTSSPPPGYPRAGSGAWDSYPGAPTTTSLTVSEVL